MKKLQYLDPQGATWALRACSACKDFGNQDETSIGLFIASIAPQSLTIQGSQVQTEIWGGINIDVNNGLPILPVSALSILTGQK